MSASPAAPLLLHAQGIAKSFNGVAALRDGRLALRAGSVHALCGGNGAGKSTFLNILMGLLRRDAGTLQVDGVAVDFASPAEALAARISIITQELSPIPGMTVAENIFLGREPRKAGVMIDYKRLFAVAGALLQRLRFGIDPRAPMHRLSLAQTQLVEIAKAFSHASRVLIMDEPTSAIGEQEAQTLFQAIRGVTAQGAGVIYVSHRLSEIFAIADSYTVLRDGDFVETGRLADIDRRHLVRQIVGRELHASAHQPTGRSAPALLSVQGLGRAGEFDDISLQVAPGEVLGIYGLMGSGRSEFLHCVYGITAPDSGSVRLEGRILPAGRPHQAIRRGLALVTEDRKATGLVLTASVADNVSLAALPALTRAGVVRRGRERALVARMVERLRIKLATPRMAVSGLSGGNQQKVVLARCLATDPLCLLCDEPTRGIDEGAKREVYALIGQFTAQGGAAIVVSSEAPELLTLSDRIAIFNKGRLAQVVAVADATQEQLLHLAS
ncbi:sugar ABC transporter ATP-binding protein [Verminephrobacter eiseniae]|uniref:sugar ABC transporter ATP-binding protein n=1 Tax=Verminephrobacter eiseniae TaxID=364317 RepID=UPI0022383BFE|nr:sugar ABC transporter ATP-binding protein [Verminephrobacter eiseniae]MCW5229855.1 sugar ABC transporter ATP-binding protein [Verminephrobacter eiseniae]MCW5291586.1 sugar ABC transporter ATP-binding protein [Verminephrobacter eiseniae]MCW8222917.1 sugar ABC transporter ATP-binding protein [Verminephrobacter eiseniae]MCW8235347.1 sugar ABC transporter ATP-binding protein [Verminephrobacter eiseniae]